MKPNKKSLTTVEGLNYRSAQWNYVRQIPDGVKLVRYTDARGAIIVGPKEPTHLPPNLGTPQVLDIVIMKSVIAEFQLVKIREGNLKCLLPINPIMLTMGDGEPIRDTVTQIRSD